MAVGKSVGVIAASLPLNPQSVGDTDSNSYGKCNYKEPLITFSQYEIFQR